MSNALGTFDRASEIEKTSGVGHRRKRPIRTVACRRRACAPTPFIAKLAQRRHCAIGGRRWQYRMESECPLSQLLVVLHNEPRNGTRLCKFVIRISFTATLPSGRHAPTRNGYRERRQKTPAVEFTAGALA